MRPDRPGLSLTLRAPVSYASGVPNPVSFTVGNAGSAEAGHRRSQPGKVQPRRLQHGRRWASRPGKRQVGQPRSDASQVGLDRELPAPGRPARRTCSRSRSAIRRMSATGCGCELPIS